MSMARPVLAGLLVAVLVTGCGAHAVRREATAEVGRDCGAEPLSTRADLVVDFLFRRQPS